MKNKKVAILSVYDVYNYGSILQTFATQHLITQLGFDNIIIRNDHRNKLQQFKRCFDIPLLTMKLNFMWRDFYVKYLNKELYNYFNSRRNAFNQFIEDNLVISPDWGDTSSIALHIKDYDYALVGSDQVWNPMNIGKDFYTMNFVPESVKKITYAPSFGVSIIPNRLKSKYINFLKKIDCISVRETSGQKIILELIAKEVPVVADPTIALPFKNWQAFVDKHPYNGKPYILCYFLGNVSKNRFFAKSLSEKLKIDIVALPHSDEICKADSELGGYVPLGVGPAQFINLIAHATYVCTDSFHATVFANLFNKEFFSFSRYGSNCKASTNSRIPSLLNILGDAHRFIHPNTTITETLLKPIDFEKVNTNLNAFRQISISYLKDALDL